MSPALALMLPATSAPCAGADELGTLLRDGDPFDTFAELVEGSGADVSGAATIFAPTDEAFRRLPRSLVAEMKSPANSDAVEQIVSLHMVASGPHASDDLPVEMRTLADAEGLGRLVTTYSLGELTLQVAPPEGTQESTHRLPISQIVIDPLEADASGTGK